MIAGMPSESGIDTHCRAAADLGYQVAFASDGHTPFEPPERSAAQIIAHRHRTLAGSFVDLAAADEIEF